MGVPAVLPALNCEAPTFTGAHHDLAAKLGATVAFDAVAEDSTGQLLRALPPSSEIFLYGRLSGPVSSTSVAFLR